MALLARLDAIARITGALSKLPTETVDLSAALGRVTHSDVIATRDLPPHDNSAMDGYAVRAEDSQSASADQPAVSTITEEIPAGKSPTQTLEPGQSARIFTGGIVPPGANSVIMQENTTRIDTDTVHILEPAIVGRHIRRAGEDVTRGHVVIAASTELGPGGIAMLAAQGIAEVEVHRRPVVSVIPTGSELCEVGQPLEPAQIYNSNAMMLEAQLIRAGAIPKRCAIVPDDQDALVRALQEAARDSDLIITSGGVSVGDFDHVTKTLHQEGDVSFWKVAIKPGKPLAFGSIAQTPVLGLPGNPVSAFVCFELFARPALDTLRGLNSSEPPSMMAALGESVRQSDTREQFLRGRLRREGSGWAVDLLSHQGSGQLSSLVDISCLVQISIGSEELREGTLVPCFPLPKSRW